MSNPIVTFEMENGHTFTAELYPDIAPNTVANFVELVKSGFYDGLIFHRVIRDFVIQGGAVTPDLQERPTHGAIVNEARWHMPNRRGTVAMARGAGADTGTAGFYINLADNNDLDADPATGRAGYCVFGEVVDGYDVAERIGNVPTGPGGPMRADVPVEPVVIRRIRRIDGGPALPPRHELQRRDQSGGPDDDPYRHGQGPDHRRAAGRPDAQDRGELPAVR